MLRRSIVLRSADAWPCTCGVREASWRLRLRWRKQAGGHDPVLSRGGVWRIRPTPARPTCGLGCELTLSARCGPSSLCLPMQASIGAGSGRRGGRCSEVKEETAAARPSWGDMSASGHPALVARADAGTQAAAKHSFVNARNGPRVPGDPRQWPGAARRPLRAQRRSGRAVGRGSRAMAGLN